MIDLKEEILKKQNMESLFIKARRGDQKANCDIAGHFLWGSSDFPLDVTQAKKHFLKAAIIEIDNNERNVHAQNMLVYIELKQKGVQGESGELRYIEAVAHRLTNHLQKEKLVDELDAIISTHGEYSKFEMQVCNFLSLKFSCMKYVGNNLGLFKNVDKILPLQIKQELDGFVSSNPSLHPLHQAKSA